jgi:hypothetical protein
MDAEIAHHGPVRGGHLLLTYLVATGGYRTCTVPSGHRR